MTKDQAYDDLLARLDRNSMPKHIGIIMDGNGRWAKQQGKPRSYGHKVGVEALRRVTEICRTIGITSLTVYAFSTENWRRPVTEVNFLMELLGHYLKAELPLLQEQQIRLLGIGDWSALPAPIQKAYAEVAEATAGNQMMALNLAVNYGGRQEIVRVAQKLAQDVATGAVQPQDIDLECFGAALDTAGQPELDLLIRPAGEMRLSNFLLWQAAYAELWYTVTLWPDFGKRDLLNAVLDFQSRVRRFGGL